MKHIRTSLRLLALATALLAANGLAAETDYRIAFRGRELPPVTETANGPIGVLPGRQVSVGHSTEQVLASIGRPDFNLSENGWVFRDVQLTIDGTARPKHENLVVVFNRGKVVSIAVMPERSLDTLVAEANRERKSATVARR